MKFLLDATILYIRGADEDGGDKEEDDGKMEE